MKQKANHPFRPVNLTRYPGVEILAPCVVTGCGITARHVPTRQTHRPTGSPLTSLALLAMTPLGVEEIEYTRTSCAREDHRFVRSRSSYWRRSPYCGCGLLSTSTLRSQAGREWYTGTRLRRSLPRQRHPSIMMIIVAITIIVIMTIIVMTIIAMPKF